MLSNGMIFLVLAFVLLCVIYFKRNSFKKTIDKNNSALSKEQQYEYKSNQETILSEDEKMEISWQFLYDITDYVLKKFSKDDVSLVNDLGKTLIDCGMAYDHVVEYGIGNRRKNIAKSISEDKNNKKQVSI